MMTKLKFLGGLYFKQDLIMQLVLQERNIPLIMLFKIVPTPLIVCFTY